MIGKTARQPAAAASNFQHAGISRKATKVHDLTRQVCAATREQLRIRKWSDALAQC